MGDERERKLGGGRRGGGDDIAVYPKNCSAIFKVNKT